MRALTASLSGAQYAFTVGQSFISDALGASALSSSYQSYSIGKGDIVVDNATGIVFFVVSVSFSGTLTATITMQQFNGVKTTNGGTTGSGNSDIMCGNDSTHPSVFDHRLYGYRIAQAIKEILAPQRTY